MAGNGPGREGIRRSNGDEEGAAEDFLRVFMSSLVRDVNQYSSSSYYT